jgi:endoglucanase
MRNLVIIRELGGLVALLACASGCAETIAPESRPTVAAVKEVKSGPGDPAHNLLKQSTFDAPSMLPWLTSFTIPAAGEGLVKNGAMCVHIDNGGANRWDSQVRHREMVIENGHQYTVSFKAWASRPTSVTGKIGMSIAPYFDYWSKKLELTQQPQQFAFQFKMAKPNDPVAEFAFHMGGQMIKGPGPIDICFDDVILSDPTFNPPPPSPKVVLPQVRVNQLGYLPKLEKTATVVSDSKQPLEYKLLDAKGQAVSQGKTQVVGTDAASGDTVHLVDFTAFTTPGKGYVLQVGTEKSDPFDIDAALYHKLKFDALKYFYLNRSGTAIDKAYVPNPALARPAGHPKDVAPCFKGSGCDYSLDVTGGWYDAGDYGKYVVNGGISVWTLLNWYERTKHLSGDLSDWGDIKGFIPESGNKVSDVLDEARWELEFFLKMQVPEGKPNAGMVHHKIHDVEWTGLGIAPHESRPARALHAVSTAATLNFAATVAQAARVWKDLDPKFSKVCLEAAERAWKAAKKMPDKYALQADTIGGGPYDDNQLADEFYWAAAELYVTTGQKTYADELENSKLDKEFSDNFTTSDPDKVLTPMTWQRIESLGKISMAVVPSKLSAAARERYRAQIVKAAKAYLAIADHQGYRVPLEPSKSGKYPWGSNSFVLNNMLVMALGYDFTKDAQLERGVALGMDYILGRNPMAQSYVTGYGTRPLMNPHHRFWAHQANPNYPHPPAGVVSGGPNSGVEDPYVKAAGLPGCAPAKCFIDHSEAWSTNEIAINWNASLMWVAAWLDEKSK